MTINNSQKERTPIEKVLAELAWMGFNSYNSTFDIEKSIIKAKHTFIEIILESKPKKLSTDKLQLRTGRILQNRGFNQGIDEFEKNIREAFK